MALESTISFQISAWEFVKAGFWFLLGGITFWIRGFKGKDRAWKDGASYERQKAERYLAEQLNEKWRKR